MLSSMIEIAANWSAATNRPAVLFGPQILVQNACGILEVEGRCKFQNGTSLECQPLSFSCCETRCVLRVVSSRESSMPRPEMLVVTKSPDLRSEKTFLPNSHHATEFRLRGRCRLIPILIARPGRASFAHSFRLLGQRGSRRQPMSPRKIDL